MLSRFQPETYNPDEWVSVLAESPYLNPDLRANQRDDERRAPNKCDRPELPRPQTRATMSKYRTRVVERLQALPIGGTIFAHELGEALGCPSQGPARTLALVWNGTVDCGVRLTRAPHYINRNLQPAWMYTRVL